MTALTEHRETSDTYIREIARSGRYRVSVCRGGIQWLLQRKTTAGAQRGAEWKSIGYFTTLTALTRTYAALEVVLPTELLDLPERIGRAG